MKLQAITKFVLLLAAGIVLSGCLSSGRSPANNEVPDTTGLVELGERSYLLTLPAGFQPDKSYKLLLVFHGSGGNASDMRQTAQFEQYSDEYIIAYPKSQVVEWNEGCGCNIADRLNVDDLGFVDQVIADIQQKYRLYDGEIYAAGFSQGGLFTQNLACNRSSVFKAVAVVAGSMSQQLAASCFPEQPLSVMMVHGSHDTVLPYSGLNDGNFGLLSSPKAIQLHANKHGSLPYKMIKPLKEPGAGVISYTNGQQKFQLYSVAYGTHRWRFANFDTSAQIIRFFTELESPELPEHSKLVTTEQGQFHVRAMGLENSGPAVILLSGPNQNYHSDSAWFAALQPLLAEKYRVYSVDRLGNAYSSSANELSYRRFADDLAGVLHQLQETEITLVSFASASISARWFYELYQQPFKINAMLYVDPDVPLPHSLAIYQGYPADWYQTNLAELLPHLAAGNWTARTREKLDAEYQHIKQLVTARNVQFDWTYFEQIMQQRLLISHQQARATEIASYIADLNGYAQLPMVTAIPVSVIDSDFEQQQIADAEPAQVAALQLWQQEGSEWSAEQASLSNGQYIALPDSDHLVSVQQPEQIKQALDWLYSQLQQP